MLRLTRHDKRHDKRPVTKDRDKLKSPPGLVEGLKRLKQRAPPEKLALPPYLRPPQRGGPPLPRAVFEEALNWLIAPAHDGDPQAVRRVRAWLDEQWLDPQSAAELRDAAGRPRQAPPKPERRSPKRDVVVSILRDRELFPHGIPADVTDHKLRQLITPHWKKAWSPDVQIRAAGGA